jgi:hypothetical protein
LGILLLLERTGQTPLGPICEALNGEDVPFSTFSVKVAAALTNAKRSDMMEGAKKRTRDRSPAPLRVFVCKGASALANVTDNWAIYATQLDRTIDLVLDGEDGERSGRLPGDREKTAAVP